MTQNANFATLATDLAAFMGGIGANPKK